MSAPYDLVIGAINASRARLNDQIETLYPDSGDILESTEFFSQVMVNNGYRRMQEFLVSVGYETLKDQTFYMGLPGFPAKDPSVQPYLGWDGFFSGSGAVNATIVLPESMIEPIELQERATQTPAVAFFSMDLVRGSMPAVPQEYLNKRWQWRNDKIYLAGALQNFDLRLEFMTYQDDFLDTPTVPWYALPVPIMRSQDCLSNYICSEFMMAQNNQTGALAYSSAGENAALIIAGKDYAEIKQLQKDAEGGKMVDRYTRKIA